MKCGGKLDDDKLPEEYETAVCSRGCKHTPDEVLEAYAAGLDLEDLDTAPSLSEPGGPWAPAGKGKFRGQFEGKPVELALIEAEYMKSGEQATPPGFKLRVTLPVQPPFALVLRREKSFLHNDLRDLFSGLSFIESPSVEGLYAFGKPAEPARNLLETLLRGDFEARRRRLKERSALELAALRLKGGALEVRFDGQLWDITDGDNAKLQVQACLEAFRPFLSLY